MKKKCTKCSKIVEGIEANGKFCSECAGQLIEIPDLPAISGVTMNSDNRIDKSMHTGDKIEIGGDSINAQNIDNSNNTTINNNIQQIQDDTKKVVDCAISGQAVLLTNTAKCPKCQRRVSKDYYNAEKRLCIDCYEKQYAKPITATRPIVSSTPPPPPQRTVPQQQSKSTGVGTLMGINNTVPPSTSAPIRTGDNKKKSPVLYIAIAVIVGLAGYFLFSNKSSNKTNTPKEAVTEQVTPETAPNTSKTERETEQSQKPAGAGASSSQVQPTANNPVEKRNEKKTVKTNSETATPALPKLETVSDFYNAAKKAYDRGNYSQAAPLFENAGSKGDMASLYYLATMYREGNGVSKSSETAFTYMLKAAQGGYATAFYEVAEMYRGGRGTEKSIPQARIWYQKVIDTGGNFADKAKRALDNCN